MNETKSCTYENLVKEKVSNGEEQISQRSEELLELLSGTIKTVRPLPYELRPSVLDDMRLGAAFEWRPKILQNAPG